MMLQKIRRIIATGWLASILSMEYIKAQKIIINSGRRFRTISRLIMTLMFLREYTLQEMAQHG